MYFGLVWFVLDVALWDFRHNRVKFYICVEGL